MVCHSTVVITNKIMTHGSQLRAPDWLSSRHVLCFDRDRMLRAQLLLRHQYLLPCQWNGSEISCDHIVFINRFQKQMTIILSLVYRWHVNRKEEFEHVLKIMVYSSVMYDEIPQPFRSQLEHQFLGGVPIPSRNFDRSFIQKWRRPNTSNPYVDG